MKIFRLYKTILSFTNHPFDFLNGLTSNDMGADKNAFLNIHGRIIVTFDQIKVSDDELWVVVGSDYVEAIQNHLDRYLKLSGVKLEVLSQNVYLELSFPRKRESSEFLDPRVKPEDDSLTITEEEYENTMTDDEFTLYRLQNNMPLHGIDYTDEMVLNVSEEFVSLTKGCYLGQEPVSKVYNRSKPRWKLVVRKESECSDDEKNKMTSKIQDPKTGEVSGFVFVKNE